MQLTVERNPSKARAGTETTGDLVDPSIVESHPAGLAVTKVGRLDVLPEVVVLEVLAGGNGVERPFALGGETEQLPGFDENRASRWALVILALADPEDDGAHAEHDCGQQESTPEADVLLNVDHADLTSKGTDVDEHVEVQEDTRDGNVGVRNDAITGLLVDDDTRLCLAILLGNQRADISLESTGSEA